MDAITATRINPVVTESMGNGLVAFTDEMKINLMHSADATTPVTAGVDRRFYAAAVI
jgi:hypothetical protein